MLLKQIGFDYILFISDTLLYNAVIISQMMPNAYISHIALLVIYYLSRFIFDCRYKYSRDLYLISLYGLLRLLY